jgi:hypothetical protein
MRYLKDFITESSVRAGLAFSLGMTDNLDSRLQLSLQNLPYHLRIRFSFR